MDLKNIIDPVENAAKQEWGALRRFISANPLSGFYLGALILGIPLGIVIRIAWHG